MASESHMGATRATVRPASRQALALAGALNFTVWRLKD